MRNSTRLCFIVVLAAMLLPLKLSAQYLVSGSGDPDANGVYQQVGLHNESLITPTGCIIFSTGIAPLNGPLAS